MEDDDIDVAEAYQAAVARNNEMRRQLNRSIIAEGGTVIPQTITLADACALHSLTRT
jgi:hypothetical protein